MLNTHDNVNGMQLAPAVVIRYELYHARLGEPGRRYVDLWNLGASLANRVFVDACPSLRPELAEPGLAAIEAAIADCLRTDADATFVAALTKAKHNVIIWMNEQTGRFAAA